jgi:purine-binding chemotaxis protein CheW
MATLLEKRDNTALADTLAGKYLSFALGGESYAIPVLKVREIIRLTNITAVPQMPAHIRGVINLRGKIIPVMDLRLRFGFAGAANTEKNCIVVVQVKNPAGQSTAMGLLVDAVEEVAQFGAADIEETPDFGAQVDTQYIMGMAKVKGVVKALLDIERVVGGEAEAGLAPAFDGATSLPTP